MNGYIGEEGYRQKKQQMDLETETCLACRKKNQEASRSPEKTEMVVRVDQTGQDLTALLVKTLAFPLNEMGSEMKSSE